MNSSRTFEPDFLLLADRGAYDDDAAARYCQDLIDTMLQRQDELLHALTEIATYDSASDELHRSVQALAGARWEMARHQPEALDRLGVFLPSNNLLYSYTLMCLIPALYCRSIEIRPSNRVKGVIGTVHEVLAPVVREHGRGRLTLTRESQRDFVRSCAEADGVVFTGRYENGLEIASRVSPRTKVLLFGSGPNPFVVGPEAETDTVVHDLLRSRLYNSGQDCLCPDAIFVHRDRVGEVVTRLGERLAELPVADRRDPQARVTPLAYDDALQDAAAFLDRHRDRVRFGGAVDVSARTVAPSILVADLHPGLRPPEFFSPIFLVCAYDDPAQIVQWATTPEELAQGMYMSVYGEPGIRTAMIGTSIVAQDCTTFDIENGNRPFGGYGAHASSVYEHGRLTARPLLISAEFGSLRPDHALASAAAARKSA